MSMTTLKYWRLIIPGIFILLLILLVTTENFTELSESIKPLTNFQLKEIPSIAAVVVFGVLYYIAKFRNILWNPYYKRVQNNIKNTLLSPFIQRLDSQQEDYLKDGRKLMIIFYHFVDNDNSLSEKAKRVRFNGLIWSSTVDLTFIAACGSLIFWFKLIIEKNSYNLWMA
ncbi:unnamed protein product, partial [marine sediment metagenome]